MGSRRHLSLIVAAALATAAGACAPDAGSSGELRVTEADSGQAVSLDVGQTLVLTLSANPTTGYDWMVTEPGAPQLRQDGEGVYVQDPGSAGAIGAGGTKTYRFLAAEPGATTLGLAYARSFEPGEPPASTFSVPVTVK